MQPTSFAADGVMLAEGDLCYTEMGEPTVFESDNAYKLYGIRKNALVAAKRRLETSLREHEVIVDSVRDSLRSCEHQLAMES